MQRFNRGAPYVLLLPYLILFFLFLLFPFIYAIFLSLFVQHGGERSFVGLQNYLQALHDGEFWSGFGRVFYYAVLQVVVMLVVALGTALLLDSPFIKGKAFFRLVYFLPYAVPGVIAALTWGFLFSPHLDPVLGFLGLLGVASRWICWVIGPSSMEW